MFGKECLFNTMLIPNLQISVLTTERIWGGALRDDTKNACVADYWKKRCWKVWTDTCIYINASWNDKWQRKTGRTTMVLTRAGLPVTHLFLPRWSQTRFPAVARRWARTGSRTFLGPSPTWFGARRPSAPVRPTSIHCMYQKESQRHDPGQKANLLR